MVNPRLSVIVPSYNESQRILQTLEALDSYLKKQNYSYEIIVVSDGSKDDTAKVVESLKSKVANLRLIANTDNHGKGYVVRQGMLEARGEYRLFTDSDNSTPIEQVEKLWPYFDQGFDVVIGSRDAKGAVLDPPQPMLRRFLGEMFGFLTNLIVGTWGIADTQCGFKALTAKATVEIMPLCKIERFAFDPEILAIAKMKKKKIKEVGILWKNDTRSTVKFKSMVKMFFDLFKIRLNMVNGVYGRNK
ncbi:MAG TPA: glycosyltransferase family 2 protein [Candidatus Paceibacterota bacterium]|nr:glycosyltransferase family 2 protein [Candidatus Pacearchaeota archaeon]HRZ50969.1 glycosyltransferase family 2 protein [Candidatus Paceibacterota bacterium]HSA36690.1 glycosyltransferase family 2 protein [Candidatus Paceibacterota bacterium]